MKTFALLFAAFMALALQTHAQDWSDFATVSMTNPTTPKLSANRLCYTDGRDLLCDGAAGLLTTSGTLQITNVSATGNVSAQKFIGDGSGLTGISTQGDRITSGTASAIANSGGGYISLTTGNTTWGYLGSSATYLPNLNTSNVSASIVSVTALQIISQSTVFACNIGNAGTLRYNSPTLSLELCTGSGWQPMGVGIPAGTISAFASTTCPTGWSEYTAARGRFLRGIDNGANLDPNGTRAPGTTQADAFQGHFHNSSAMGNANTRPVGSGVQEAATTGSATGAPVADGTNGTPRTSSETRPVNVAVTFCQFNGTSNGWNNPLSGGGTATPAGSTADVQFNSAGALAADTGLFTYSSGVLKAPTVSATTHNGQYASFTTITASSLGVGNVAASGNVSISGVVKIGTTAATCSTGISGTMRYNTASNTMEYCNGAGWLSLGPSATTVPAFSVYRTTNQTVTNSAWTLVDWTNKMFDTNNNFDLTNDKFTPLVAGKYYVSLAVDCMDNTTFCQGSIYKNGAAVATSFQRGNAVPTTVTALVDMNGTTDYLSAYVLNAGGTTLYADAGNFYDHFEGTLIASGNGLSGGGGTTTPAGSDTQLQLNSSGSFGASSNLTFDSSARNLAVSGSVQYGGTGSETCSSAADYGKNRRNPVSGRMQVCLFR